LAQAEFISSKPLILALWFWRCSIIFSYALERTKEEQRKRNGKKLRKWDEKKKRKENI